MQFDQLKRREFLTLLGGAAAALPLAARAQSSPIRPLIGFLSPLSAAAAAKNIAAFRSALRDLGYVEGRNMTLASRYGDGAAERMPSLARELDPVAAGLARSMARPGGNVTGTWNFDGGKGLDFLKLALPSLTRVGVMFNPDEPQDVLQIRELPAVVHTVGVTIESSRSATLATSTP
jgi:putative tryptophan/tyrosine transport system substrate-binding protein